MRKMPTPVRDRIVAALKSATSVLSAEKLADIVYADDPDGGPLNDIGSIRVTVLRLRKEGHPIERVKGTHGGYIYHVPGKPPVMSEREIRARKARSLRAAGLRRDVIASRLGVSVRSVANYLADGKVVAS